MEKPFPAYSGDEPYIFVSYAHKDAALVYPELIWLKDKGCNIWYDEGISPGSRWSEDLARNLSSADRVLYFGTANSANSNHCLDEFNFALQENKMMIVVHLEKVDLPPGMRLRLGSHQAISKFELGPESYKKALLDATLEPKPNDVSKTDLTNNKRARKSIAVLPFTNMSSDSEQEYFSDGISEDILKGLVKFSDLKVIARTSSFQFKGTNRDIQDIGTKLNVNHVLEGSVRKSGNQVRITVQLIKVSDSSQLWSERYDRKLDDVFEVQDEVTEKILSALGVHLATELPTRRETDIDAYQAFLMGMYANYRSDTEKAIRYFKEAIALDPEYEDAYLGLMEVHLDYALVGKDIEPTKKLIAQYQVSLASINPNQPILKISKAMKSFYVDRDYQLALNIYSELVHETPNDDNLLNQLVFALNTIGRIDLSLACQRHRLELDPLNPKAYANLGHSLIRSGHYQQAEASLERSEEMGNPTAFSSSILAIARHDLQAFQFHVDRDERSWTYLTKWQPLYKALCAYLKNDDATLKEVVAGIDRDAYPYHEKATLAIFDGNWDLALTLYRKALESAEIVAFSESQVQLPNNPYSKMFPEFSAQPAFQEMRVDFGLDQESVSKLKAPDLPFLKA